MAMGIQVETCRGDRHLMPHKMHAGFQHILCACQTYMLIDMLVHIYIYTHILQLMKGHTEKQQDSNAKCKVMQCNLNQFGVQHVYIYIYTVVSSNPTKPNGCINE